MESTKELRQTDKNLLRRIQRQMDKETQESPFIPSPEKQLLMVMKEEVEKSPDMPKRSRLSLYENRKGNR